MTDLAQWSALVGFLIPLATAIIQQPHFTRPVRTAIGIAMAVIASVVTAAVDSKLNFHTWATSLIYISVLAFTTYRNVWVPLGAADWIESVTSKHTLAGTQSARVSRTGEAHGPGNAVQ